MSDLSSLLDEGVLLILPEIAKRSIKRFLEPISKLMCELSSLFNDTIEQVNFVLRHKNESDNYCSAYSMKLVKLLQNIPQGRFPNDSVSLARLSTANS